MSTEDGSGEDGARVTFSDADAAFLRHARFGRLPARVRPEDLATSAETDGTRDLPETVGDPVEWRYSHNQG